jgi:hypothetical protein
MYPASAGSAGDGRLTVLLPFSALRLPAAPERSRFIVED